jgi:hypothetical protein
MQPIDVSWARSFKAFLPDWPRVHKQPERRVDQFMRLGLPLEGASEAQISRARIVFWVIDAAHEATTRDWRWPRFDRVAVFLTKRTAC